MSVAGWIAFLTDQAVASGVVKAAQAYTAYTFEHDSVLVGYLAKLVYHRLYPCGQPSHPGQR